LKCTLNPKHVFHKKITQEKKNKKIFQKFSKKSFILEKNVV